MQKYVMLTQDNCKYCTAALGLLESHGYEVTLYDVADRKTDPAVASLIVTKTVPQIYDPDGVFIGGYTELKEHLLNDGKRDV